MIVIIEQVRDPETNAISLLVNDVEVLGSLDEDQADMAQQGAWTALERVGFMVKGERHD